MICVHLCDFVTKTPQLSQRVVKEWDSLPANIVNAPDFVTFWTGFGLTTVRLINRHQKT